MPTMGASVEPRRVGERSLSSSSEEESMVIMAGEDIVVDGGVYRRRTSFTWKDQPGAGVDELKESWRVTVG